MKNTKLLKSLALSLATISLVIQPVYGVSFGRPTGGSSSGESESGSDDKHPQNRSTYIGGCEKFMQDLNDNNRSNWNSLLSLGNKDYPTVAKIVPSNASSGLGQKLIKEKACEGEDPTEDSFNSDEIKEKIADFAATVALCEAYRVSTLPESYSDDHHDTFQKRNPEGDSSAAGNALACMNQADPTARNACIAEAGTGPQMTCKHNGAETHDYLACKKIMDFVTAFALGKQAMNIQQGFRQSSHDMENQEDLLQKQRNGEANLVTDSMAVQRDSLQK